jgi:hypothetical protein
LFGFESNCSNNYPGRKVARVFLNEKNHGNPWIRKKKVKNEE